MNIPHQYQLFTAAESREIDQRTIEEYGIDGFTLMEIAGTRAADFILSKIDRIHKGLIICGRGNNAGDALVVARILSEHSISLDVLFVDGSDNLSPDCSKNLQLLKSLESDSISFVDFEKSKATPYDFIVDGMLGTGLNSNLREPYYSVLKWVNNNTATVFSMDIPTGLNADNGQKMGDTVRATYTLTFGTLKHGLYQNDGYECCGQIIFCELPFPSKFKNSPHFILDENWFDENNTDQKKRAHKYDGGVVYIIAGSEGLTGAAILSCLSAWNTGIGAVVLITPKGLLEIYDKQLIHIIKKPVGNPEDVHFSMNHVDQVLSILSEKKGTLLIGPGLGREESTIVFTRKILSSFKGKCVIDADALLAISSGEKIERPENSSWILTPHPGELSNFSDQISLDSRLEVATNLSSEQKNVILSKGLPSIIASPNGSSISTNYDTRMFSRAGFGDVLAGKVTGYFHLTNNPEQACCLALSDGKEKALELLKEPNYTIEPLDII